MAKKVQKTKRVNRSVRPARKTVEIISNNQVLCEGCGRKIPKERLRAIPNTSLCVSCAAEFESEHDIKRVVPLVDYDYDPQELLDAISPDE